MRAQARHDLDRLIQRIAENDVDALGSLFDATSRKLLGLVRRIVGDLESADETLLDVYAQVWRHADHYDASRGGVWSWLLTLTRTRALDRLRSRSRRLERFPTAPFHELLLQEVSDSGPGRVMLEDEVRTALARLPRDQRRAVESAYFEGLSYSQVAQALALPVGTVKSRIRVALTSLRRSLEPARREFSS